MHRQCKQCRREGQKLFLKGERCLTDKCGSSAARTRPGEHGRGRIKQSEYRVQLREKQKARRYYGVLEKQFHGYYVKACRQPGITGENLLRCSSAGSTTCSYVSVSRLAPPGASARPSRPLDGQRQAGGHPVVPGAPGRRDRDQGLGPRPPR